MIDPRRVVIGGEGGHAKNNRLIEIRKGGGGIEERERGEGGVLWEILKNKLACFGTCASALVGWPAMYWHAMVNLFLSLGL